MTDAAAPPLPLSSAGAEPTPTFELRAYSPATRAISALLLALAAATLLYVLVLSGLDLLDGEGRAPTLRAARWLVYFCFLPYTLTRMLRQTAAATLRVEPARLVLTTRTTRFEIPMEAVKEVRLWRLPLPGPGLTLWLKSGRVFGHGLEREDVAPVLEALGRVSALGAAERAHPLVGFAQARAAYRPGRWALGLKFGLAPLVVAVIFFRAHQYIAYGGPFAEYHMYGLAAYLRTFLLYWVGAASMLLLYSTAWRIVVEAVSGAAAWFAPRWARGVRRFAEIACVLLYYVGVPALILMRFFL